MSNQLQVIDPERVPSVRESPGMIEVAKSREAQEAQAALLLAKRFPRNETEAFARIVQACKRKGLAEGSQYVYKQGGTKIEGPSIRLAEVLFQAWGNCESGVVELERRESESVMMAYAIDLESNTRDRKIFTVPHIRERGEEKGGNLLLTDPRDVYELVANMAARRKRACMLAIIPGDIVDAAIDECNHTLAGQNTDPLIDRVRKIVAAFLEVGVTGDMLIARLGHTLETTGEAELVGLRKIYTSLKDGMSKASDWFQVAPAAGNLDEGKSRFGFYKAKETTTGSSAGTTGTPPPPTVGSDQTGQPAGGTTTQADGPEAREAAEKKAILADIDKIQDARRISAAFRANVWKHFCGGAKREEATLDQLTALREHLQSQQGGGKLI